MVLEPEIMDLIEGDSTVFEKEPLVEAARSGQLNAYRHKGFWQCMDTLREKNYLEELWAERKCTLEGMGINDNINQKERILYESKKRSMSL